ncbi:glycosyltransferase family 4 protein [Pseudonocardia nigra]|uniref:glycosyltransferase family 4 protein n=1 Tax=Pseudonocardia nigra TaxID=1921578 RepID=UPI001C5CEA75|nr:glycosyltransferase family 4 protein [Pseudonocardia nigra]
MTPRLAGGQHVDVAVVVDSDAFGGAEVWTTRVLDHLPDGMRASLVVAEPVADRIAVPAGIDRVVVPLARHRESAPDTAAALAALAPDVVHVNLVDPASNRATLAAALAQAPTVAALHLQGVPPDPPEPGFRALAAAVAPSGPIAAQLVELGVPAERVVRVRHGVPLPATPARPRGEPPLVVGAVGRLTPQKGIDVLLAATARLHARGRALRVVIAGAGRDEAELRRRAAGLPVTFPGFCTDVPALLRGLDVFCLPSRAEALSLALLEAVAHGLPCLTTAVGDTVGALDGCALVVGPDDVDALTAAMDRLLTDPDLRRELGRRARERAVRDFAVTRMAGEVASVWRRAAPDQRPATDDAAVHGAASTASASASTAATGSS